MSAGAGFCDGVGLIRCVSWANWTHDLVDSLINGGVTGSGVVA